MPKVRYIYKEHAVCFALEAGSSWALWGLGRCFPEESFSNFWVEISRLSTQTSPSRISVLLRQEGGLGRLYCGGLFHLLCLWCLQATMFPMLSEIRKEFFPGVPQECLWVCRLLRWAPLSVTADFLHSGPYRSEVKSKGVSRPSSSLPLFCCFFFLMVCAFCFMFVFLS